MIDLDKLTTWNTEVNHAFHGKIVECDMREASLQIAERFKLLPQETINSLKLMDKEHRVKSVGNIQKERPEFSEAYYSHLKDIRRQLISTNKLPESSILAVHSDAIFINTHKKLQLIIDGIEFKLKHKWTSYIRYENYEFLYNDDDESITYKGINSNILKLHTIGLCKHILKTFSMIENNDERIFSYLSDYQAKYLSGELPENCYIPFGKVNGDFSTNLKFLSFLCKVAMKEC